MKQAFENSRVKIMQAGNSAGYSPEPGERSAVVCAAVAFIAIATLISQRASAGVIYDDFDGNAAGWSTGWTQIYSFVEPSPINGNAMRVSARGGFAVTSAVRRFPTINDGVVYVSVLAHAQDLFPLERDSYSAGFDFTVGPTATPSHPTNLPAWGLGYASSRRSLYLSGSGSGPAIADDVTYRLVARISKGASGNFEHTELWKDPVSEADTIALSGSLAGGVSGINSFVARAQNPRGNSYFDEVVIGNSFAEVVYFRGDTATVAMV